MHKVYFLQANSLFSCTTKSEERNRLFNISSIVCRLYTKSAILAARRLIAFYLSIDELMNNELWLHYPSLLCVSISLIIEYHMIVFSCSLQHLSVTDRNILVAIVFFQYNPTLSHIYFILQVASVQDRLHLVPPVHC